MIFVITGKSASGKDSIYKGLLKERGEALKPLVIYTTRPRRAGEEDGREYFFTDVEHLNKLRSEGKIIEERVYHPACADDWYYFTADDGKTDYGRNDYLNIGTLESYVKLRDYFGGGLVTPLYIESSPAKRLARSLERESRQESGNYREICRRFLADEEDFSEENIAAAGITKRFSNDGAPEDCLREIGKYIDAVRAQSMKPEEENSCREKQGLKA